MNWKLKLYRTVSKYIIRDIHPDYQEIFINWWHVFSEEILNEFEFVLDDESDQARKDELLTLKKIIESDANIDNDDANVKRILTHINTFVDELDEEVEYETPDQIGSDL